MRKNQVSLLVIRCPYKPFSSLGKEASYQDSLSLLSQEFTWYLSNELESTGQSGIGTIESMPYADDVLVLIPTLDIRLIEVKIPLVSDKKLQVILPGLMEEYLLQGVDHVHLQVLPPLPNAPALQRVVAVIDRAWFTWLNKQLTNLLSSHVQMVPDCYLLNPIQSASDESKHSLFTQPSLTFEYIEHDLVWTVRTSEQIGASWVERINDDHCTPEKLVAYLPSHLSLEKMLPLDWNWLMESAHQFIGQARYAGINLLPSTFRFRSKSGRAVNGFAGSEIHGEGTWGDTRVWYSSVKCLGYCFAALFIGMSLHLSWLTFADWRWNQQMQLWAIPYLSTDSATALVSNDDHQSVLTVITKQAIQDKRIYGLVSNADFPQMASDLQRLSALYGGGILQSLEYNGHSLDFELKPEILKKNQESLTEFVTKANILGLGLISLGGNQFRLLPYSGLGGES